MVLERGLGTMVSTKKMLSEINYDNILFTNNVVSAYQPLLNLMADVKSPFNLRLSLHQLSNPSESFFTNHVVPPHHVVLVKSIKERFQTIVLSRCLIFYKTIVSKTVVYEL